jgi:hypothetical protein
MEDNGKNSSDPTKSNEHDDPDVTGDNEKYGRNNSLNNNDLGWYFNIADCIQLFGWFQLMVCWDFSSIINRQEPK